jgi:hypothetical protein
MSHVQADERFEIEAEEHISSQDSIESWSNVE